MRNKIVWILAVVIMIAAIFAGCGGQTSQDYSYADAMLDNILAGIENRDYSQFSLDFSDKMKGVLTEDVFNATCDLLDSKIGDYQSRTFTGAEDIEENDINLTFIVYNAKYSDEPANVIITIAFSGEEGSRKVETLVFNSPKLRQQ